MPPRTRPIATGYIKAILTSSFLPYDLISRRSCWFSDV